MRGIRLLLTLIALIAALEMLHTLVPQTHSTSQYPSSPSAPIVGVSEPEVTDPPLDIGKTFTVDITLKQVIDLYTWQAGMTFNASILEATVFSEGNFLKQGGTTLWVTGTIDNANGVIGYHAASLVGNATGVSGNGALGTIVFVVEQYGNSTLHLTNVILLDSTLSEFPDIVTNDFTLRIKIPGDINGDDQANVVDLNSLGKVYGSTPTDPNWNPDADINQDGVIDGSDLALLSDNYGKAV